MSQMHDTIFGTMVFEEWGTINHSLGIRRMIFQMHKFVGIQNNGWSCLAEKLFLQSSIIVVLIFANFFLKLFLSF
jgi:hypothetical protein